MTANTINSVQDRPFMNENSRAPFSLEIKYGSGRIFGVGVDHRERPVPHYKIAPPRKVSSRPCLLYTSDAADE